MMKKLSIIAMLSIAATAFAQSGKVGINTTAPAETLQVNGTVRISSLPVSGTGSVYNGTATQNVAFTGNQTVVADTSGNLGLAPANFTNLPKYFYMPSVMVDTSSMGTKTMDLYSIYYNQFNAPPVKSAGAATSIPTFTKSQLMYYVTYYDTTIMNNLSIDANGVLTYTIIGNATDASFMNVVFVAK